MPKVVADLWLSVIVKDTIRSMEKKYPFIKKLNQPRLWTCYDMGFNLGTNNKKTLLKTMTELEKQLKKKKPNYKKVSAVMKSGAWYKQVKTRAAKLCAQMEGGKWA